MLETIAMTANAEAMPMPIEVPVERLWLEAGGIGVGGVVVSLIDVVAEAEAAAEAAAEVTCDCEMVGADVATLLLVEELTVDVADHVATEGPGVFIYWKESVFPIVALTNEKWQPAGFAPPTEEST
jgi:hypothetical protein